MKTKKVRAAGLLLPLAVLALLWLLSWPASAEEPAVSAALDASGTQINVTLSASAAPADASKVQFPTWSGENGQDDLVWHTAVRAANGDWTAAIPLSSHKGYGSYTIHCYVQSPTKGFYIVGSAKVDVPRVSGSVTTDPTPVGGGYLWLLPGQCDRPEYAWRGEEHPGGGVEQRQRPGRPEVV